MSLGREVLGTWGTLLGLHNAGTSLSRNCWVRGCVLLRGQIIKGGHFTLDFLEVDLRGGGAEGG